MGGLPRCYLCTWCRHVHLELWSIPHIFLQTVLEGLHLDDTDYFDLGKCTNDNLAPVWLIILIHEFTSSFFRQVVAYRYNYVLENNAEPVWEVAGKVKFYAKIPLFLCMSTYELSPYHQRCLLVVIGVVAASIMYCIPFPITGRVELRYRLAQTVRDIGTLYSALIYSFENVDADSHLGEQQRKKFAKLALNIQRQIALERTLLAHAKYEPPLRGKYPQDKYAKLLDTVDNMADMVYAMVSDRQMLLAQESLWWLILYASGLITRKFATVLARGPFSKGEGSSQDLCKYRCSNLDNADPLTSGVSF